jgi:phospholipid/cholesterol/gamma-HCH transport system substrate-binding protein
MRTRTTSLASSPTMVGAITTLITIVAVFLAYNASTGLPFVPVYRISAELPNAQRLIPNNEVRIAGRRIGIVEEIEPISGPSGEVIAQANLKLDRSIEPLPDDTEVRVRYSSAFGLKYLELIPGDGEDLNQGGVLPLAQAHLAVEADEIGNTFDQRTREAVRAALVGFGDALAARGGSLNQSIDRLNPLLAHSIPVAAELAAPDTQLRRFFRELGDVTAILAPVADQQAELFANGARTFAALSADPSSLQEAISEGVPTLEQGTVALRGTRPFLSQLASLSVELRPGAEELRLSLPAVNEALFAGADALPVVPEFAGRLNQVLEAVDALAKQPQTKTTLLRLGGTFADADHVAKFIVPFQTVCDYWNYWFTFFPSGHSEPTEVGTMQRDHFVYPPGTAAPPNTKYGGDEMPMSPVADYAGVTANGRRSTFPLVPQPGIFDPRTQPILHAGGYVPPAVTDQGRANCLVGQTGYPLGQLRAPGQPPSNPAILVAGDVVVGPTFAGRERLP